MVLDFLHDDTSTLYASSLVTRDWLFATRYRTFSRVILSETPEFRRRLPKDNVHSFLELVNSPHCTFLSAIQCVVLNMTTQDLLKDVVHALTQFRNLSQMVFMQHNTDEPITWNARSLPNIRDFTINTLGTTFKVDAWTLIASVSELHSLSVYTHPRRSFAAGFCLPLDNYASHFRNLRTLRLRLVPSEALFSWFQKFIGAQMPLETLDIWFYGSTHRGWGVVTELNLFLKSVSKTLKHLSIGMAEYDYNGLISDSSVYASTSFTSSALKALECSSH